MDQQKCIWLERRLWRLSLSPILSKCIFPTDVMNGSSIAIIHAASLIFEIAIVNVFRNIQVVTLVVIHFHPPLPCSEDKQHTINKHMRRPRTDQLQHLAQNQANVDEKPVPLDLPVGTLRWLGRCGGWRGSWRRFIYENNNNNINKEEGASVTAWEYIRPLVFPPKCHHPPTCSPW